MNQIASSVRAKDAAQDSRSAGGRWAGRRKRMVLLLVVPLVVCLVTGITWLLTGGSVSTDDAYVKADKIIVAPRISGHVVAVAVTENQPVSAGQLLFRLDPEPFRLALAEAEANSAQARNDVESLKAAYRQKQAELKAAEGTAAYWGRQFDRQQALVNQHDVAVSSFDQARNQLDNARAQVAALDHSLAATLAALGGDINLPTETHPKVKAALAQRDRAALNLSYTDVKAPADGYVAQEDLRAGDWLQAGQAAFAIIGSDAVWVEANFKETDLTDVRPGQPAAVAIDTYPGRRFSGHVVSIARATGAEFALLPAQNASGNWVKVVQRIPVRIALKPAADWPPLRAGMSADVAITTGEKHSLAALFGGGTAIARPAREP